MFYKKTISLTSNSRVEHIFLAQSRCVLLRNECIIFPVSWLYKKWFAGRIGFPFEFSIRARKEALRTWLWCQVPSCCCTNTQKMFFKHQNRVQVSHAYLKRSRQDGLKRKWKLTRTSQETKPTNTSKCFTHLLLATVDLQRLPIWSPSQL